MKIEQVHKTIQDVFEQKKVIYKYGNIHTMDGFERGKMLLRPDIYYFDAPKKEIRADELNKFFYVPEMFFKSGRIHIQRLNPDTHEVESDISPYLKEFGISVHIYRHYLMAFSNSLSAELFSRFEYDYLMVLDKKYLSSIAKQISHKLRVGNKPHECKIGNVVYYDSTEEEQFEQFCEDHDWADNIFDHFFTWGEWLCLEANKNVEQECRIVWRKFNRFDDQSKPFNISPPKKYIVLRKINETNFEIVKIKGV